jgi:RnfABCDGE-type electron transport complex B subunit
MNQVIAATAALGAIGLIFSLFLALLNRKLRVKQDPQVAKITSILPGLNCGACGFSSCQAYAQAIVEKPEEFNACRAVGEDANRKISEMLGQDDNFNKEKKYLVICRCSADEKDKKVTSQYQGLKNCQSAELSGGALDCVYGCLGFGDCQTICPTGAITIKNKKVYIDQKKCILCSKCIKACPRNLFKMIPKKDFGNYFVGCQNKDKLKEVKDVCARGCITCGLCARVDNSPYYLKENLSEINYEQVQEKKPLEEGKKRCPTKCIDNF